MSTNNGEESGAWTGGPVTLRSGRIVELVPVSLTELLLSGLAPNQILNVVYFYDGGSGKEKAAERVKEILEARLMVCARGLTKPRLRLGPDPENILKVTPNKARGEVGPTFFKPEEINEMYLYLIGEALPPIADLPFSDPPVEPEAAARAAPTGDDVRQESE